MNPTTDRTSWRESFVAALNVLAEATACLPVGALDPALSGASALELYTGGLWSMRDVQLFCAEPHPLMIELFAIGFRWVQRPRRVRRVLWHHKLQVGFDLVERSAPLRVAEQANALAVAIDLTPNGEPWSEPLSVKVVGVEDLIVRQVGKWLHDGAAPGEAAARLQVLVGLAREGVGGPLRTGYLQRRLATETNGEVVFDSIPVEEGGEPAPRLRRTSLTQMQSVISVWRSRCGLSMVEQPRGGEFHQNGIPRGMRNRNHNRGGGWGTSGDNVIALDDVLPVPSD